MGCRSGITRRIQSSMSAWLSEGTGGFRAVFGLCGFAIACSPLWLAVQSRILVGVRKIVGVRDIPGPVVRGAAPVYGDPLVEVRASLNAHHQHALGAALRAVVRRPLVHL